MMMDKRRSQKYVPPPSNDDDDDDDGGGGSGGVTLPALLSPGLAMEHRRMSQLQRDSGWLQETARKLSSVAAAADVAPSDDLSVASIASDVSHMKEFNVVHTIEHVIDAAHYDRLLFEAAKSGDLALTKKCLRHGANVHWRDVAGNTPLQWAAINGKSKVAKVLLQAGARVDNVCKDIKNSVLHSAARGGSCSVIKWCLKRGVPVDVRNSEGTTPLMRAVTYRHLRPVKYLVRHAAHPNARDHYGATALHLAAHFGFTEIASFLIQSGADVNDTDMLENTPMHLAAQAGRDDMALLLVENAADVNKQNEEGRTALHYAAKQGLEEMAQLLIVRGAKQTILDKHGKTPYDMGNAAMRHAFINAGKDKPKLTKQQRAAIARAARIEREKKKQQEDLLRAQEEQAEAAAERARRQNEEYAARIEAALEKRAIRLKQQEDAKRRRDERRNLASQVRDELEAARLKKEEDRLRDQLEQERRWLEHQARDDAVDRAKRIMSLADTIVLIKTWLNKTCRIGAMRSSHIAEQLVVGHQVYTLEGLYRMYGDGVLAEKAEKLGLTKEEYALMELEMPWMSTTVLREGDVRVDASKISASLTEEVLNVGKKGGAGGRKRSGVNLSGKEAEGGGHAFKAMAKRNASFKVMKGVKGQGSFMVRHDADGGGGGPDGHSPSAHHNALVPTEALQAMRRLSMKAKMTQVQRRSSARMSLSANDPIAMAAAAVAAQYASAVGGGHSSKGGKGAGSFAVKPDAMFTPHRGGGSGGGASYRR